MFSRVEVTGDFMKFGFIGFGRMGSALASSIIDAKTAEGSEAIACDVDGKAIKRAVEMQAKIVKNNAELVRQSDVVFLCVKPSKAREVLKEVKAKASGKLVVSIMAGVKLKTIEMELKGARVIRVMPNAPLLVEEGATAYCLGKNAGEEDAKLVEKTFSRIGLCVKVKEEEMNAVTGLSGSGPAYVYEFVRVLAEGAEKAGLNGDAAKKLAVQTVFGAAKMMKETGKNPLELIEMVKSPGGTTEQGLKTLEEKGFSETVKKAVENAAKKAEELSKA
ncbi:pyrroline-5-carboxylate reductase [Candidatus Micrarchaeota archaeon]|nr:pyrroline-5-carboxylate reductase [Candidatus Micrarchaeota archaeon]